MKCWLNANPKNRKTRKGIERFIVSWLNRSQDKAPRIVYTPAAEKQLIEKITGQKDTSIDDDLLNQLKEAIGD